MKEAVPDVQSYKRPQDGLVLGDQRLLRRHVLVSLLDDRVP